MLPRAGWPASRTSHSTVEVIARCMPSDIAASCASAGVDEATIATAMYLRTPRTSLGSMPHYRVVTPPRIVPPAKPLGRLAFISTFVRNPLEAIPRAVYEEDFVPMPGGGPRGVWITSPSLVKSVLLD